MTSRLRELIGNLVGSANADAAGGDDDDDVQVDEPHPYAYMEEEEEEEKEEDIAEGEETGEPAVKKARRKPAQLTVLIPENERFGDVPKYEPGRRTRKLTMRQKIEERMQFFTDPDSPGVKGLLLSHSRVHQVAMEYRNSMGAAASATNEPATPFEAIALLNEGKLSVSAEWMTAVRAVLTAYLQEVLKTAHELASKRRGAGKGLTCSKEDVATAFAHVDCMRHGDY